MEECNMGNMMFPNNVEATSDVEVPVPVYIEGNLIKEEEISEERGPDISEEVFFCGGAIKVEYSFDKYKDQSSTADSGSSKPELIVPDLEPVFTIKEEKMEDDDDQREILGIDDESTSSDSRFATRSHPAHSHLEATNKEDQERRSTSKEINKMLKRPRRLSRRSTPTTRKPFQCTECDKSFPQNCDLKIHLRTHTGEKPFQCDECGQRFTQHVTLRLHLRIHTGEKPYQCEECKRMFRLKYDLKKHQRIHTEEKPFQCEECELRFRLLNDLKKHRRRHAGEKLFQCDKCEKQFSHSSNLTVHRRVHTGEKPFPCTECPQAFMRSHDLKRHLRIHTGERPFQCDECEHRFSQRSSLKTHLRTHTKKGRLDVTSANKDFLEETFEDSQTFFLSNLSKL